MKSIVWGRDDYDVSQPFGIHGGPRAEWYQYSAQHGFPSGYHIGVDVAVPKFTPIYANESGTVEHAGWSDSFRPNPVYIKEQDGDTAIYGHLWEASVFPGQKVERGQLIGYSGEQTVRGSLTPDGSGPHIHFELRDSRGNAINPTFELQQSVPGDEAWRGELGERKTNADNTLFDWFPDTEDINDIFSRFSVVMVGIVIIGAAGFMIVGKGVLPWSRMVT